VPAAPKPLRRCPRKKEHHWAINQLLLFSARCPGKERLSQHFIFRLMAFCSHWNRKGAALAGILIELEVMSNSSDTLGRVLRGNCHPARHSESILYASSPTGTDWSPAVFCRSLRSVMLAVGLLVLVAVTASADAPKLAIPRITHPPKLEEFVGDGQRSDLAKITGLRQRDPGDGDPVSQPTTVYLGYDDRNFYAVFVCTDEPDKIRAHMSKREDILSDDSVGIFLDTFHDHQRCYEFLVNPLGIQLDGIATEGQNDDFSFDTVWRSEGKLTATGYAVLIAIPFKSLRFKSEDLQNWGISVARIIQRNNETSFWPYITHKVQAFTSQFADAGGIERISPGRNIQLIPYGFLARAKFLDDQIPAFKSQTEGRVGLDAKVVFHDSLTLDITLEPDFSQVESDDPQVTVNQRFEVFFPEKRPFFMENAGFFSTPETLFFSRRIANPQFGARLTGKVGRWDLGVLAIDDRAPGQGLADGDPLAGKRAGIGVARIQREFGADSKIGVLVTSRDFAGSSNRVASIDTRLKLSPQWYFIGQAMESFTHSLDGTKSSGAAYYAELYRQDRHMSNDILYQDRSPAFRSDLGFIPRVDIRQFSHFLSYRWRPEKRRISAFGPNSFTTVDWDRRGRVQDWRQNIAFDLELKGQTFIFVRRAEFYELFQNLPFREHQNTLQVSTSWVRWLELAGAVDFGRGVNYFPGNTLAPFLANAEDANLSITLRPSSRLRFQQTYLYDRLGLLNGFQPSGAPSTGAIFNNHILRSKINYQFSRELSLRAILDYNAVLPNSALVNLDKTKRVTGDVLLTYLIHPGTAFYAGFTDTRENLALLGGPPTLLERIRQPSLTTGRQFFVKLSYLFRM
jgi:hypothetical protein